MIAVIGVNSLSGSSFAKFALESELRVIGFGRYENANPIFTPHLNLDSKKLKNFSFFKANMLQDYDEIAKIIALNKCEVVINFAAQSMVAESWHTPEDWYDVNVSAFSRMISCIFRRNGEHLRKFINFTTPEVYGSTVGKVKENWDFNPNTPYAISRAASDFHLRALANTCDFPVIFTRTANVYGPHQKLYRVIPKLIIKVLKGEKFELHGGGNSLRSFIHTDDVAIALLKIMQQGKIGETYHISSEEFISIADLTLLILSKLNRNFEDCVNLVTDRVGKDSAYLLDSEKIRSELNWNDQISLSKGVDSVIQWINQEWSNLYNLVPEYVHTR